MSAAGKKAGIRHGTRSGLWTAFADAIDKLKPATVIIENVRGLLNATAHRDMECQDPTLGDRSTQPVLRAAGAVCGDLADIGYDSRWTVVSAAAAGAPHRRERIFFIATPTGQQPPAHTAPTPQTPPGTTLPTPISRDWKGCDWTRAQRDGTGGDDLSTIIVKCFHDETLWQKYVPAVNHWQTLTRPAPNQYGHNSNGKPRLSAQFAEWMMGWPAGWVTDPAIGLTYNEQITAIGNGVVPQQADTALRTLLSCHTQGVQPTP